MAAAQLEATLIVSQSTPSYRRPTGDFGVALIGDPPAERTYGTRGSRAQGNSGTSPTIDFGTDLPACDHYHSRFCSLGQQRVAIACTGSGTCIWPGRFRSSNAVLVLARITIHGQTTIVTKGGVSGVVSSCLYFDTMHTLPYNGTLS